ncbi:MAG: class I SAM-dependent methyltransferase, partial [Deltaproteobacteria bacterium]|nr:class I SAM-dependent methyltransferase [Deltaproteobacteria bacterium]
MRPGIPETSNADCPCCGSAGMSVFYEVKDVPVHSVLLMPTREAALAYPRGDIALACCPKCGFIGNAAFEPSHQDYSPACEENQAHSPRFRDFDRELARDLIERHDLQSKDIVEIGCGKGDFLKLLCALGNNRGVGFDPAYRPKGDCEGSGGPVRFIADVFSDQYAGYPADLVCCKMTLEHIPRPDDFLAMIRRSFQGRDPVFYFQVPDATRILREFAFWDIYYEHCAYFSPGALARLFRAAGFVVEDLFRGFGDQYLLLEARLNGDERRAPLPLEEQADELWRAVSLFSAGYRERIGEWRDRLATLRRKGGSTVLWGGGSKAVSFMSAVGGVSGIRYVVDINPRRQGTF